MTSIPHRLKQEPLIEAIWELRFEKPEASDALPGQLYEALRKRGKSVTMKRLPTADIPAPVVQMNPAFRYAPRQRITEEPAAALLWQTGDQIITLNCCKPYIGWLALKPEIEALIEIVEKCDLNLKFERHSLRYINVLTLDPAPDISALAINMKLGGHHIQNNPLQLRTEIKEGNFGHVIQIATPAEAHPPEGPITGTIVDLETHSVEPPKDFDTLRGELDVLHDGLKELFFDHILSPKALKRLEPEYQK
jgi:uncharacterized protein (TIGR04255 family)